MNKITWLISTQIHDTENALSIAGINERLGPRLFHAVTFRSGNSGNIRGRYRFGGSLPMINQNPRTTAKIPAPNRETNVNATNIAAGK